MFPTEIFELIQKAFKTKHPKFSFPTKQLKDSSEEFQQAIFEATIEINKILLLEKNAAAHRLAKKYNAIIADRQKKINSVADQNVVFAFIIGILCIAVVALASKLFLG